MGPYTPEERPPAQQKAPHPSYIQVAKPYIFESKVQECLRGVGATSGREDNIRLQGVLWIDNVRKFLLLPVRTYNTACVYYHKFRLVFPDNEYDYRDAAAAALFTACKIEDTLKKSRDIVCASYNLNRAGPDQISQDDPMFEAPSKAVMGIERLMLEASGFDFRNRYPQKMLLKFVKDCKLDRKTVGEIAYRMSLDLYRTYAPLKQTTQTLALACLELAARLANADLSLTPADANFDYHPWRTTRAELLGSSVLSFLQAPLADQAMPRAETMADLLDLYNGHRAATSLGSEYTLEDFVRVGISLNRERNERRLPRYTLWDDPKSAVTSPADSDRKYTNGNALTYKTKGAIMTPTSISPQSPAPSTGTSERSKMVDGTVRFILDPGQARDEKDIVRDFFKPREIEEYVTVETPDMFMSPTSPPETQSSATVRPSVGLPSGHSFQQQSIRAGSNMGSSHLNRHGPWNPLPPRPPSVSQGMSILGAANRYAGNMDGPSTPPLWATSPSDSQGMSIAGLAQANARNASASAQYPVHNPSNPNLGLRIAGTASNASASAALATSLKLLQHDLDRTRASIEAHSRPASALQVLQRNLDRASPQKPAASAASESHKPVGTENQLSTHNLQKHDAASASASASAPALTPTPASTSAPAPAAQDPRKRKRERTDIGMDARPTPSGYVPGALMYYHLSPSNDADKVDKQDDDPPHLRRWNSEQKADQEAKQKAEQQKVEQQKVEQQKLDQQEAEQEAKQKAEHNDDPPHLRRWKAEQKQEKEQGYIYERGFSLPRSLSHPPSSPPLQAPVAPTSPTVVDLTGEKGTLEHKIERALGHTSDPPSSPLPQVLTSSVPIVVDLNEHVNDTPSSPLPRIIVDLTDKEANGEHKSKEAQEPAYDPPSSPPRSLTQQPFSPPPPPQALASSPRSIADGPAHEPPSSLPHPLPKLPSSPQYQAFTSSPRSTANKRGAKESWEQFAERKRRETSLLSSPAQVKRAA